MAFYLFRVLYLSEQRNLGINWTDDREYGLAESRQQAVDASGQVLEHLYREFPATRKYHDLLNAHYRKLAAGNSPVDYTFLYGKWMSNSLREDSNDKLKNFDGRVKEADEGNSKTIVSANAVEEIVTVQIDKRQMEDAVLQHQFEKVETAEEFGGNWRDVDGGDELEDHLNALDELNMKYAVRIDDSAHSVYQADFMENTTVMESAEKEGEGRYLYYDEWDYTKKTYKENFCKLYPKAIMRLDMDYYRKTLVRNNVTLTGLRKMLTTINNKYQQQRRQSQGEEFDMDALTDFFVDMRLGQTPTEKVYLSKRKKEKDLSILLLLDVSLSSDGYAAGNRIIDVEKEVSILFGEILNEFNIDFFNTLFLFKDQKPLFLPYR